jgi:hypothetical protein
MSGENLGDAPAAAFVITVIPLIVVSTRRTPETKTSQPAQGRFCRSASKGMSRRTVAKHACDGCKIRKIKCTDSSPCEACLLAGIACTFVKYPKTRGPRKLRDDTLQEIRQTQQQWKDTGLAAVTATQSNGSNTSNAEFIL